MFHIRIALPLLMAAVCTAQEAQPTRTERKSAPIVTMEFEGGSMGAFVKAVQKAEPKANIILAREAVLALVPAMEIKDAGLDQLLECACAAAEGPKMIDCMEKRGNGVPVYTIIARDRGGPTRSAVDSRHQVDTTVLSLNRLTRGYPEAQIAGLKVESILSAIEAGGSFDGDPPAMRYHEPSGLLFLHGTRAQLALAQQVLQILEGDMMERTQSAGAPRGRGATGRGAGAATDPFPKRDR